MTLRKEISDFIRLTRNGAYTSDMITSDILDMIEKRIDSIQDQLKKDYDDDLVVYGIDESFSRVKEVLKWQTVKTVNIISIPETPLFMYI